ncbi:MAG TPA: ATP-binding protein, partial [Tepidisphaeraceae bacterium]
MIYHPNIEELATNAPVPACLLPGGFNLMERASAALRDYLRSRNLDDYIILHAQAIDLEDIDAFREELEPGAAWQPLPLLADGHQPHTLARTAGQLRLDAPGVLHLPSFGFVLARWHFLHARYPALQTFYLAAATTHEAYTRLHDALIELRRRGDRPVWQIFHDVNQVETKPRQPLDWSNLLLPEVVSRRLTAELVRFFSEPVAALYRSLEVPYRRGVLMHGPPGNGKTSIIRALGASLPDTPAIILRPAVGFDDGDLQAVFRRWTDHAPAMLVIEDLDHVLKLIDLSQFLNLIDGIEGSMSGGLLLVATTNHPELLDPALNNRPGRFDV